MKIFPAAFCSLALACSAFGQSASPAFLITTIAGGAPPATSASATSVMVLDPVAIVADRTGNVYISSDTLNSVFKLTTAGALTRVAGTGIPGFSGDGDYAAGAALHSPKGIAVDAAGNLYIADCNNNRVRMVTVSTGVITTVAGSSSGTALDGGPATRAALVSPLAVALDTAGNLYIAEGNSRVRKVTASTGTITTIAGNGTWGFSGDGGPATSAALNGATALAVDTAGNLYIADEYNQRIRKVTALTGVITTVAGRGAVDFSGDGGPATSAAFSYPRGLAVDGAGNLYVADSNNYRIRKIAAASGVITTVAGSGPLGFSGDGGSAVNALLNLPGGVAVDASGNLFIADTFNCRVRKVSTAGIISTVVGGGTGDGRLGVFAHLLWPTGVARDPAGNLYLVDEHDHRVRKVAPNGVISTLAGTGTSGFSGDGGAAAAATLNRPFGVAVDTAGNVYIADFGNGRVRKVTASGIITTVAGTGSWGYSGDGGAATSALLDGPEGVAVDAAGNLYIADEYNHRIRKVAASTGVITTVAGNGSAGFSGDDGAATTARLDYPYGVALDTVGNLYIADYGNSRVRKVTAQTGVITTVAGNGNSNYSGDGGAATAAALGGPQGVAVDTAGNIYIADTWNSRIRRVAAQDGVITTVAGTGDTSSSPEGVAAAGAALFYPFAVGLDTAGNVYVADTENGRLRLLTPTGTSAVLTVTSTHSGAFTTGQTGTYTILIANAASAGPTSGTLTVTEALPAALTLVSMSGAGWTCSAGSCTRADSLAGGSSYPVITVTVNAGSSAPEQVTNQVSVSGGGAATTGAQDLTILIAGSSGNFPGTCSYTLAAAAPNPPSFSNAGGNGTATVTAGTGCAWTAASSDPAWLATGSTGSGNGVVSYAVAANAGTASRTGTITAGGQVLSVTQAGTAPPTVVLPTVTAVSSASYQAGGAPDSLLSVFGSNLAKALQTGTPNASGEWPQSIGGTSLEIDGRLASLVFVSPAQINCLVPGNTGLGTATLNVKLEGTVIATGTVPISNTFPGLFSSSGTGSGPAAALNAVTYAPAPFSAQTAENAGTDKRTRIALFGIGIRYAGNPSHTPNTNVARNLGITAADASGKSLALSVEYAGPAPGFAGLDQVNVVLPAEANQDTTITVKVTAGTTSNAVTLALRQSGIVVTPTDSDSFAISGTQGQFTVGADRKVYTVRNAGASAVTLRVRAPAWLSAVPATAEIAGGASLTVTVATNSSVNSLAEGPYFGTVDFSDGSVTVTRSVVLLVQAGASLPTLPSGCEYAAAPTSQLFRALNTLSSTATVMWGNVHLDTGGYGSIPIGFEMRPGECDVYGLPARGDYDINVSRSGGGSRDLVVTFDGSSGFVISGRRVYTLRIASGTCSAAADAGISFGGQTVYSVCP